MDATELREQARQRREGARQKAAAAKLESERQKALRANPVPQYVEMTEPSGDAEADSLKDLGELESGFRRRAADEGRRFALVTDSEYWGAICFRTRAQKEAFFGALGVLDLSIGARYFDGNAIAERLGIALPDESVPYTDVKPDPAWAEFVKEK